MLIYSIRGKSNLCSIGKRLLSSTPCRSTIVCENFTNCLFFNRSSPNRVVEGAAGQVNPDIIPINATNDIVLGKTSGGVNPFLTLPDPTTTTDYKKGYVMRKCCVDPNGKKTKLGKRSWKMFFLSLRDMVLYCFKEEKSLRLEGAFCDLNNAIRIHHGLAERATDYSKKQFVFRLHTADQVSYTFKSI